MEKSYIVIYNTSVNRLEEDLKNNNITRYIILNNTIASIYVDDSFDEAILNNIDSITWVERSAVMSSLIELTNNLSNGETVRTAAGTEYIYKNPYITPTGEGVIIVIIDSGINYLHPDFIKSDNTTKIISIWDQESTLKPPPEGYLFGSEFSKDEINEYINRNDPSLSVDNVGTGTIAAGIAAGLGRGNSNYDGVAIDAELVIIKLKSYKDTFVKGKINYEESDFLAAIKYALEIGNRENKRMVINLTVGCQSRASIEMAMIDSFYELSRSGRILVGGAG
ncbi:S8 family serine peptidase, partial [Romboutsia ilealis]|uniref:S8 family serine peptidase n=2 Tax=Peptostreptococcaceae TaxID=186804 RepID=UPI002674FFBE